MGQALYKHVLQVITSSNTIEIRCVRLPSLRKLSQPRYSRGESPEGTLTIPSRCQQELVRQRTQSEVVHVELTRQSESSGFVVLDVVQLAGFKQRLRTQRFRLTDYVSRHCITCRVVHTPLSRRGPRACCRTLFLGILSRPTSPVAACLPCGSLQDKPRRKRSPLVHPSAQSIVSHVRSQKLR